MPSDPACRARMGTLAIIAERHGEAMSRAGDVTTASRQLISPSSALLALRDDRRALPLRAALVGLAAIGVARLHAALDPGVLCPFRRLTGVPCPICGSTTATLHLGRGQLLSAFAAQPFMMALTAVLVAAPGSLIGACRSLAARPRLVLAFLAVLAISSWLYQIFRFGLL